MHPPLYVSVLQYSFCSIALIANVLLLIVLRRNTAKTLKPYSVLIMSSAINECVGSATGLTLLPRIVPVGYNTIVCVFYGLCSAYGSNLTCSVVYTFMIHAIAQYNVFMTASFSYRYYILQNPSPPTRKMIVFCVALFTPTFVVYALFVTSLSPEAETRKLIAHHLPHYNFTGDRVIGINDLVHSRALPGILWIVVLSMISYAINGIISRSIFSFLDKNKKMFSERTRKLHRDFATALTYQTLVSQFYLFSVSTYVIGQLNFYRSPAFELSTHLIGQFCMSTSPLITLYVVRPYRKAIVEAFGFTYQGKIMRGPFTLSMPSERIKSFRDSLFFQLFATKGFLFCSFAVLMPRCQLMGECLISINRLLAIHRPLESRPSQNIFIRISFFTIFVLPILTTIPDLMTGYHYVGAIGSHNTIILFTSQLREWVLMDEVSKLTSTLFQFLFTIFALACNCGLFMALLSRKQVIHRLKSSAKTGAEYGLALTALLMFSTHLSYALIMIYYNFSPVQLFIMAFTTPALDLISILPIWLLFVCSNQVRRAVLEGNNNDRVDKENPPPSKSGSSQTVQFRLRHDQRP